MSKNSSLRLLRGPYAVLTVLVIALLAYLRPCAGFDSDWPVVHLRTGSIHTKTAAKGFEASNARRRLLHHDCHTEHPSWGILRGARQALVSHPHGLDHAQRHQLLDHIEASGARVMGYLPENTWAVVGSPESLAAAANHSLVMWSGYHEPAHKIAPEWQELIGRIEAAMPSSSSTSFKTTTSTGGNGTVEAQALAASILAQLPVQVRRVPGQWPQIGIRVQFPTAHNPQPLPSYHPDAAAHSLRIQRVLKEQESYTAGEAAVSDWAPILQTTFGNSVEVLSAGPNSVVVFAAPSQVHDVVEWLAERPAVRWVSPLPRIFLKNKQASVVIQSSRPAIGNGRGNNGLDPSLHPIWAAGIQGQNQVIGQGDSGLDYQHCFFVDPTVDWASSVSIVDRARTFQSETHRKIRLYRAFADFTDANGHGTHTAGTLAGIPYGSTVEEDMGIGMAPEAKLAFIDLSSAADGDAILTPYDLANDYFPYTTSVGAQVHSDSWGSTSIMYDNEAAQVDAYCWKNPNFLPIFPAGNDGDKSTQVGLSGDTTVNSPATSKNCFAAGATQTSAESAVKGDFVGKVWAAKAALGPNFALNFRVLQSDFSNSFSTLDGQVFNLVVANPISACSPLTNAAAIAGGIALMERGNCTFVEKAQAAQAAGAAGALVFDDQAAAYFVATGNGAGSGGSSVTGLIPTATMPRRLGQNLLAVLSTGRSIEISFSSAAEPDYGYQNLASFSSQGPVGRDKRIKPDIVAPGTITSAAASGSDNCGVATFGGTSMATPVVAGAAVLVRQYFLDGYYPSGVANAANGFNPTSALVKAVMIGGAAQLDGYEADTGLPIDPTPSFRQGFGRVFLGNSLFLQNNPYSPKKLALLDSVPINTGDVHQYCITSGGGPLTVTLVWTDYPGEPSAAVSLVNDLDLVVRAEGLNGQSLLGNGGGVEDSSEPDRANNIEQVSLPAVPAGRVSVEVRGSSIQAFSGSQPYALVINGDFSGVLTAPSAAGNAAAECAVVVATITSGPTGVTNAKKISFELGTTSGVNTGVSYECRLADGRGTVGAPGTADWASCTSPATYDNLPDGMYAFSVRASGEKIDSSVVFTKDTAPPVVSLQGDVPATTSAATAKMTFGAEDTTSVSYTCRVSVANASPQQGEIVSGSSVAIPVQQGTSYNCTSPQTLAWLLPGQWTFAVEATDAAGNKAAPVSAAWTVDVASTTQPSVRVTAGPILKIPKREVKFSLATLGGGDGSATECSLVGVGAGGAGATIPSEWSSCANAVSYGQPSDGDYLFAARVVGDASTPQFGGGLPSTWAVSTFSVDSTPPTVNVTNGPTGGRAVSDTTVTFEFNLSEEGSTAQCKLDAKDVPSDSIPFTPCASPVQLTNLTGGHYNFSVTPSDAVGNNGAPYIAEFVVDGMPPNISSSAVVTSDNQSIRIIFAASDGSSGAGIKNVTCRVRPAVLASSVQNQIDPNDPRFNWQQCTSPFTFNGVVEGHWIASVVAFDNADQASKPSEMDVWVDTIAPVTSLSSGPKSGVITPGGRVVFSLSDSTEKDNPGAGSPVQWQGLLKSVSEDEFSSYSRTSDTSQAAGAPSIIKRFTTKMLAVTKNETPPDEDIQLGRGDLNTWRNCTSECTYDGLGSGAYLFQARGIDASGNLGEATTPPVAFKMEGVSSGLPTWALIAIIVGSVVIGIALLAILWTCCCKNNTRPHKNNNGVVPNGVIASNGNSYATNGYPDGQINGWNSYGSAPPPLYMNGSSNGYQNGYQNGFYPAAATAVPMNGGNNRMTASPLGDAASGRIQIPDDPIEAQELALALAASNAQSQRQNHHQQQQHTGVQVVQPSSHEDAELKAAMEASLAEEQRRRNNPSSAVLSSDDAELNAAIQASLEEQRRFTASGWEQPPPVASAPPQSLPPQSNPFAEWPPRS